MPRTHTLALLTTLAALTVPAFGDLPAPPQPDALIPAPLSYTANAPGAADASALLPAAADVPITVRDGHFYRGTERIRFWGVNVCFSGNYPTHEQADAVAARLRRFGINAVRFHHTDSRPFPNGIFSDSTLETLSPEALDRLDYFIAALKRNGIYADLNLHVSRDWARAHHWPNADRLPHYDKMVDLYNPDLIKANRQYAHDLLTHVNKYTGNAYASEPAIALIEINNENSFFIWGGQQEVKNLPEPYAGQLKALWNQWLVQHYTTRDKLAAAWNVGVEPAGQNLLASAGAPAAWTLEQHAPAAATRDAAGKSVTLTVSAIDDTSWHLQYYQPGLHIRHGQYYTFRVTASAPGGGRISVGLSQAHEPWHNLGLTQSITLTDQPQTFEFGFVASADDDNARISFAFGGQKQTVTLDGVQLYTGGQTGLAANEDPAAGSVASSAGFHGATAAREHDWLRFLADTEDRYYSGMRDYLKHDLGVKAQITGTIGIGALGTKVQSSMDYVDSHSYWDHPRFPGTAWSSTNWNIKNSPMVDDPAGATLERLAAIRVAGKPHTVTEYNHAAPNVYQSECVPFIATTAALQDWDGVFIFAYTHDTNYFKTHEMDYFNIEGNPMKMPEMALGARLFVGAAIGPLPAARITPLPEQSLLDTQNSYYNNQYDMLRATQHWSWDDLLKQRVGVSFAGPATLPSYDDGPVMATWKANGAGTGQYQVSSSNAAVFVGFPTNGQLDLGPVHLTVDAPFVSAMLVAADPTQPLATARRLLLSVEGRGENPGMQWNANRTSVSTHWGQAPTAIEMPLRTLTTPGIATVTVLSPDGAPTATLTPQDHTIALDSHRALWVQLNR